MIKCSGEEGGNVDWRQADVADRDKDFLQVSCCVAGDSKVDLAELFVHKQKLRLHVLTLPRWEASSISSWPGGVREA